MQNEDSQDDGGGFYWDPRTVKNREPESQKQSRLLQEQLSEASMKISELELELKRLQHVREISNASKFWRIELHIFINLQN